MRHRAFTIIELAISMAIAGIVVAAATTAAVNVTRLLKLESKKSIADQDARRLVDFVIGRMQGAAGAQVRPWMAMWLEENCAARNGLPACDGHDRLTIIDVDNFRDSCSIQSITSSTITFAPPVAGVCCYDWPATATANPLVPNQFHNQTLMLVNGRDLWTMVTTSSETGNRNDPATPTCAFGMTGIRPLSQWADAQTSLAPFNGAGASAQAVAARTLYLGSPASASAFAVTAVPATATPPLHLLEWFDDDYNMQVDVGESRVVFPGVYDLQVSLGYDDPEDGRILDNNTPTDQWLGNAAETGPNPFERSSLRMAGIGVVVGVKAVEPGQKTMSVLNGPAITRSSHLMRKAVGKAMLRNIAVFY